MLTDLCNIIDRLLKLYWFLSSRKWPLESIFLTFNQVWSLEKWHLQVVFHFKSIATPEHRLSQPQSAVNAGSLITRWSLKFFWSIINVLMSLAPRLLWVSVDSTFLLILQALNSCRDNAGIGLVTKLLLKNKLEGVIFFFFVISRQSWNYK